MIKIIKKNDEFNSEYDIGDTFEITGTWYGGVHIMGKTGVPVSLDKDEYMEMDIEADAASEKKNSGGHFYFVRHGQTVWNVENKICGATDIALTELGHQQAIETGKKILKEGIKADEILYSPLIRAADTARHISEVTGIPMRMEPRLIEQNFGKWESTPRDGADFKKAKECFAVSHEGGESTLKLAQRIYNLLDDIRAEADKKTYILVAHNGIARVVKSYFTDMTNEEYAAFGVKNCEIVKFDF